MLKETKQLINKEYFKRSGAKKQILTVYLILQKYFKSKFYN